MRFIQHHMRHTLEAPRLDLRAAFVQVLDRPRPPNCRWNTRSTMSSRTSRLIIPRPPSGQHQLSAHKAVARIAKERPEPPIYLSMLPLRSHSSTYRQYHPFDHKSLTKTISSHQQYRNMSLNLPKTNARYNTHRSTWKPWIQQSRATFYGLLVPWFDPASIQ